MKLRKWLSIPTAALLGITLTACSDTEETSNDQDNSNEKTVEITYARGVDTTGSTEKLIEAFHKKHPNIKVNYQEMPNSSTQQHDQYVTAFSSKSSEIDVFDADVVWPAEFAQANYAMELDRFIDQDKINMDDYFPGTVEAGKFEGKQWAMPKYSDAGILYYRTDLVGEPPKTWDELIKMAKESSGKEGTSSGFVFQAKQYEGIVVNAMEFIASYGGKIIDENNEVVINSPEAKKGLSKMVEIANADFMPNNILTFSETETESAFNEGQAVFARNWPYMAKTAADQSTSKVAGTFAFTSLPAGDAGSASTLGGYMAMINRYTDHPKEAWEFVKFMTSEEGQKISATEGGRAPTLKALYDDKDVQEAAPVFKEKSFVETLENAVPRPVTPNYQEISDILQIEISKALTKDITVDQAIENMESKMKAALKE